MPEKEVFGAMPPLEILRQYMQYSFWCAGPNANPHPNLNPHPHP